MSARNQAIVLGAEAPCTWRRRVQTRTFFSAYDNVDGQKLLSGPGVTEWLYLVPGLRKLEPVGRAKDAFTKPSERDGYLLGATLFYLLERFHERRKPFAIYAMGHTHEAMLVRFDVRAEYTSTAHEEATAGEMTP